MCATDEESVRVNVEFDDAIRNILVKLYVILIRKK